MIHDDERGFVVEEDFFELVDETHLVAPFPRDEREGLHLHHLFRIRRVVAAGSEEVAEGAPSEKIGDEADLLSVPGVEDRARGAFPIQLFDRRRGLPPHVHLHLLHAARPEEADVVRGVTVSESEVKREVALGEVAARRADFTPQARVSRAHLHFRAESIEVAPKPLRADGEPRAPVSTVVPKERELASIRSDHEVQVAVGVDVGHGESSALALDRSGKRARPLVARGLVFVVRGESAVLIGHQKEIEVGVVVGVDELDAVSRSGNAGREEAGRNDVGPESGAAGAAEERIQLAPCRGEEEIEASVPIEVRRVRASSAASGLESEIERALGKGAHAVVREQKGTGAVIDHHEIDVAIVVDVGKDGPEAPRLAAVGAALLRDLRERAVGIVSIEPIRSSRVDPAAVSMFRRRAAAGPTRSSKRRGRGRRRGPRPRRSPRPRPRLRGGLSGDSVNFPEPSLW